MQQYLEPQHPLFQQMRQLTGYTGKRYQISTVSPDTPMSYHAYWDGGSRTTYTFINLETWQTAPLPVECTNPFRQAAYASYILPFNIAVLEHHILCGKDMGLELRVREDNATNILIRDAIRLSYEEKLVLEYTAGLKSSYAGIKDFRFTEANRRTGISKEAWDTAKTHLISTGHLTKAGAITVKGRNANLS